MAINAFSNLSLIITGGGTIPSLDYLSNEVYVDIGSGNVLKVAWSTPTAENNIVDSFRLCLRYFDTYTGDVIPIFNANIGLVNEFYITSSMLSTIPHSFYKLAIYVEAVSSFGAEYNCSSSIYTPYVSKGCGTYMKVEEGYTQPIMKRSLAFAKLDYLELFDEAGDNLLDADGNPLFGKVSSVQDDSVGWTLMQEFYSEGLRETVLQDATGRLVVDSTGKTISIDAPSWQQSDIQYEVLTDSAGEIVIDINNETVYVL